MKLSDKIEQAGKGSRELDEEIAIAIGWELKPDGRWDWLKPNGMYSTVGVFPYTTSLDAAMTLADGMKEVQIWNIWNAALRECSRRELDIRKDVARFWSAAALRARGL